MRHERGKRLWFDVSEVPPEEQIIGAELRLYRNITTMKHRRSRGSFTITAYRVFRTKKGYKRKFSYSFSKKKKNFLSKLSIKDKIVQLKFL